MYQLMTPLGQVRVLKETNCVSAHDASGSGSSPERDKLCSIARVELAFRVGS